MHVTSIRYQPVEGGALGGHFALHVTLGAGDSPGVSLSATELTARIHDAFQTLNLKTKVRGVLLDCREAVGESDEMSSLLEILKDWGCVRFLWVNETTRYAWFDPSQHIVVFVKSQHWPNFRVNEIRYVTPLNPDEWAEPDVYDVNGGAYCYLLSAAPKSELLRFVTECKRPWGIIGRAYVSVDFPLKAE